MISYILSVTMRLIRPFFGISGTCKFTVSCTAYAQHVLAEKPLLRALWLIVKRLVSCW